MRWSSCKRQLIAMTYFSGLSETTWILRFLILISVTLISACENDEIIKPEILSEPSEPPLPVREWYPAPKHRQQPTVYVPVPATQQPFVMSPPAYQGNAVQQPWGISAQQPVYSAPQPVYQAQPPVTQQQPSVWSGQQPVIMWPQPVAPQYQPQYQPQYRYTPRPWGSVAEPNNNPDSPVSTDAWPQGGYMAPWGTPATGGNSYWTTPGQTGQLPGTANYGSVW